MTPNHIIANVIITNAIKTNDMTTNDMTTNDIITNDIITDALQQMPLELLNFNNCAERPKQLDQIPLKQMLLKQLAS